MIKVTVIMPCYNGEKYISRCFESLLKQTFKDFEVIFVDDGSTDNTKQVVLEYKDKFNTQHIPFYYIYKENGGAASALNVAFKQKLSGEYLLIMDSDDELTTYSLEHRCSFLDHHPDIAAAHGYTCCVDYETQKFIKLLKNSGVKRSKKKTFYNILIAKNIVYPGWLFRKKELLTVLPRNGIFESKYGQNWQLLLPMANAFKLAKLPQVLYKYNVIQTSHSHSINSPNKRFLYINGQYKIRTSVLNSIENFQFDKQFMLKLSQIIYLKQILSLHFYMQDFKGFDKVYKLLKKYKGLGIKDRLKKFILKNKFLYRMIKSHD